MSATLAEVMALSDARIEAALRVIRKGQFDSVTRETQEARAALEETVQTILTALEEAQREQAKSNSVDLDGLSKQVQCVSAESELLDLISAYWAAGYAEGRDGRVQDTEDGLAQKLWGQITSAIRGIEHSASPPEAARPDGPKDPTSDM